MNFIYTLATFLYRLRVSRFHMLVTDNAIKIQQEKIKSNKTLWAVLSEKDKNLEIFYQQRKRLLVNSFTLMFFSSSSHSCGVQRMGIAICERVTCDDPISIWCILTGKPILGLRNITEEEKKIKRMKRSLTVAYSAISWRHFLRTKRYKAISISSRSCILNFSHKIIDRNTNSYVKRLPATLKPNSFYI